MSAWIGVAFLLGMALVAAMGAAYAVARLVRGPVRSRPFFAMMTVVTWWAIWTVLWLISEPRYGYGHDDTATTAFITFAIVYMVLPSPAVFAIGYGVAWWRRRALEPPAQPQHVH